MCGNILFQNLVSKKRTRYSKVILILAVIGLLLLGCVLFMFLHQDAQNLPQPESLKVPSLITLQGIINGSYEPTRFNGTWVSGTYEDIFLIVYSIYLSNI